MSSVFQDRTYIPDDNFEQAIIDLGFDDVLDDYVLTSNINEVGGLGLISKNISDLTGIEGFRDLLNLDLSGNNLSFVDLSKNKFEQIMKISSKVHSLVGCRGVTRSDFKYYRGKFYLLEINTQPGMTKLSLVPEIAAFRGISFIKLIELILKDASTNK